MAITHELDGSSFHPALFPERAAPVSSHDRGQVGQSSVTEAVLESAASGLAKAEAALSPAIRKGGIAYYAVRRLLRIHPASWYTSDESVSLRRWTGIAFAMSAWMALLVGLAHLVVAAVHNREGELGLGLDNTLIGARACLIAALLAALGVPMWVAAERRLRRQRDLSSQESQ